MTVVINGGEPMGPFDIDSYSTDVGKKKKDNMFVFTHEVDGTLSTKMLDALKNGDTVDIHISTCKVTDGTFKQHTVWLTGGSVTSVTETSGDGEDDFPKEKIKGKFTEIERMTETGSV